MARNGNRRGGHREPPQRGTPKFSAGRNPQRNLLLGLDNPTGQSAVVTFPAWSFHRGD